MAAVTISKKSIERTGSAILSKLGDNRSVEITLKNGIEIIVAQNSDGYTLYKGCELICGDAPLNLIAKCMIEMNGVK